MPLTQLTVLDAVHQSISQQQAALSGAQLSTTDPQAWVCTCLQLVAGAPLIPTCGAAPTPYGQRWVPWDPDTLLFPSPPSQSPWLSRPPSGPWLLQGWEFGLWIVTDSALQGLCPIHSHRPSL